MSSDLNTAIVMVSYSMRKRYENIGKL